MKDERTSAVNKWTDNNLIPILRTDKSFIKCKDEVIAFMFLVFLVCG